MSSLKTPVFATLQRRRPAASRRGFTLVELLIVVGIVLLLAGMVVYAIQPSQSSRLREAGRVGQAAIMGARDRALHAKAKRGFRLVIDPNDSTLATGFVYLQPMDRLEY
ncbi:MAG: type II secretion system protein, partial [Planctomycetales bacterium]